MLLASFVGISCGVAISSNGKVEIARSVAVDPRHGPGRAGESGSHGLLPFGTAGQARRLPFDPGASAAHRLWEGLLPGAGQ